MAPDTLRQLARVMRPGAELWLATDDAQLAEWIRARLRETSGFEGLYESQMPPPDWIPTRYEAKGRAAGRQPNYFCYRALQQA